jgi:serine/threonine protein kinase
VKLIDFDLAINTTSDDINLIRYCGTIPYMAPEMFLRLPLTPMIDIWSIGCTLFELFTGRNMINPRKFNQIQVIAYMNSVVGPIPNSLLSDEIRSKM